MSFMNSQVLTNPVYPHKYYRRVSAIYLKGLEYGQYRPTLINSPVAWLKILERKLHQDLPLQENTLACMFYSYGCLLRQGLFGFIFIGVS